MRPAVAAWVAGPVAVSHPAPRTAVAPTASSGAESLYRGGGATVLEVLDSYTTWVDARQTAAAALLNYRTAEAELIRWGTP